MPGLVAGDDLVGIGILTGGIDRMPFPSVEQSVVLVEASGLEGGFDGGRATLGQEDSFFGGAGCEFSQTPDEATGGFRGEVIGDVDKLVELRLERGPNLWAVEPRTDAFVGASKVEYSTPVGGVAPTPFGTLDGDGAIISLGGPAMHQMLPLPPRKDGFVHRWGRLEGDG